MRVLRNTLFLLECYEGVEKHPFSVGGKLMVREECLT
jgi:hypothetical protein